MNMNELRHKLKTEQKLTQSGFLMLLLLLTAAVVAEMLSKWKLAQHS